MSPDLSIVDRPRAAARVGRVQRRTLAVLAVSQVLGNFGTVAGISVGVLLAGTLAGTAISGLAQSLVAVGQGLLAVPLSRLMDRRGRRTGLAVGYAVGAAGAGLTVLAAGVESAALLLVGLLLFGGAGAGNYQTRYAAADLATPTNRARHVALVLWVATLGAVLGPNLAAATDALARRAGFAPYAGPFLAALVGFALCTAVLAALLRPDPLLLARTLRGPVDRGGSVDPASAGDRRGPGGSRGAWREIAANSRARLGVAALGAGNASMIAIMAMTPFYIGQFGHAHDETLRILGVTIGAHVIGMYAFSPLFGWLADRAWLRDGRRVVILGGLGLLLVACAVTGTANNDPTQLALGLGLVGLGWSATIVAGSTMLTEAVAPDRRPSVQGVGDMLMTLAAAVAGVIAGLITAWSSFPTLTAVVAVGLLPVVALGLRPQTRALGLRTHEG
ncbi:MAG: MFS transporter [Micromonosporaceae bacterium]|nr:MFS transporter [Micromonosporaceae bacterium]